MKKKSNLKKAAAEAGLDVVPIKKVKAPKRKGGGGTLKTAQQPVGILVKKGSSKGKRMIRSTEDLVGAVQGLKRRKSK